VATSRKAPANPCRDQVTKDTYPAVTKPLTQGSGRLLILSLHARGYLSILMAGAMWGLAGAAAKYLFAAGSIPPFILVQLRTGGAFLVLVVSFALFAPHLLRITWPGMRSSAIFGVFCLLPVMFTYLVAISETNVATAIFLQYLGPIFAGLYATVFEKRPLGRVVIACLGLALCGSFLLLFGGGSRLLISQLGLAAGLLSAVSLAAYTIYASRIVTWLSPLTLLCYGLGAGMIVWLVIDLVLISVGIKIPMVEHLTQPQTWLFLLYIAILATALPFALYLSGLKVVPPVQATIVGMTEPVVGGLAGFLLLGEILNTAQLSGGALIVVAVIVLQAKKGRPAIVVADPLDPS